MGDFLSCWLDYSMVTPAGSSDLLRVRLCLSKVYGSFGFVERATW
jgi:hypothetical protein